MSQSECCTLYRVAVRLSAQPYLSSSYHRASLTLRRHRQCACFFFLDDKSRHSAHRGVHTTPVWQQRPSPPSSYHPSPAGNGGSSNTAPSSAAETIRLVPSEDEGLQSSGSGSSIPLPAAPPKDVSRRMSVFLSQSAEDTSVEEDWVALEADRTSTTAPETVALAAGASPAEVAETKEGEGGSGDGRDDTNGEAAPVVAETDNETDAAPPPGDDGYADPPYREPPLPASGWHETATWRESDGVTQTIDHLLFNVSGASTSVHTCVSPVDRVELRTPLYDWHAKEALFYKTHWLQQMTLFDLSGRAEVHKEGAEPPAPQTESLHLNAPVGDLPADGEGSSPRAEASVLQPPSQSPPTHQYIVGRPKVVRYLFFEFLKKQHLWMDSVEELMQNCAQQAVGATAKAELPSEAVPVSAHLLHLHRNQIIFSSPHMTRRLHAIITKPSATFLNTRSAKDVWEFFVLHHRHNAALLPSPQRPPFSFGEVRPRLAPSDFGRLRYWGSADETLDIPVPTERPPLEAASGAENGVEVLLSASKKKENLFLLQISEHKWNSFNDFQQNKLLFGSAIANEVFNTVQNGKQGIYTYSSPKYDASGDEGESEKNNAEEAIEEEGEEPKLVLKLSENEQIQQSKKEDERRRLGSYDVDRFYLGFIEPILQRVMTPSGQWQERLTAAHLLPCRDDEGHSPASKDNSANDAGCDGATKHAAAVMTTSTAAGEAVAALPFRIFSAADKEPKVKSRYTSSGKLRKRKPASSGKVLNHVYFSDGLFCNAHNGELEDAQLSQLWQSFQSTDTSALLDLYVDGLQRLDDLRQRVAAELATQYAFLLLFFARDEVRAITSPKQTYYRLSYFHAALREVMHTLLTLQGVAAGPAPGSFSHQLVPFESLSPHSQCSFTFFGAAHIPSAAATLRPDSVPAPPLTVPRVSAPWDLHEALRTAHADSGKVTDFAHLRPLQQLALSFCFASSEKELVEEKWHEARGNSAAQAELRRQMDPVTFMVPSLHKMREAAQRKLQHAIRRLQRHKWLPPHAGALVKRKRGRPRKVPLAETDDVTAAAATGGDGSVEEPQDAFVARRKRGRPRKTDGLQPNREERVVLSRDCTGPRRVSAVAATSPGEEPAKMKRGRPRKAPKPVEWESEETVDDGDDDRVAAITSSIINKISAKKKVSHAQKAKKTKKTAVAEDHELVSAVVSILKLLRAGKTMPAALTSSLTAKKKKTKKKKRGKKSDRKSKKK